MLLASLGPEHASDELLGVGMAPFFYLPHTLFVAERGLDHFDLSMRAQYELTKRFSAEASIRPYIARDPERTFAVLRRWTADRNAHVRRLVSEGTRLRLPWAARVAWLDAHPERVLELLELLKDDPSTLVRRSVANNLNDLGKLHPDLLLRTCAALAEGGRRRAPRAGRARAAERGEARRRRRAAAARLRQTRRRSRRGRPLRPARVAIGGRVAMTLALRSKSRQPQALLVDVAVHFVKARGHAAPKVFKLKRVELAPRQRLELQTAFSLAVHTTRVPRPGRHAVDVIINGQATPAGAFHVTDARA